MAMFTSNFPVVPQDDIHIAPARPASLDVSIPSNEWNQLPPAYMPWSGMAPQPRVTRFSGEAALLEDYPATNVPTVQPVVWNPMVGTDYWEAATHTCNLKHSVKRKLEDPLVNHVSKQQITEEKISAHLSQLHINPLMESKDTPSAASPRPELLMEEESPSLPGLKLSSNSRIVLSEELRRFKQESSIPAKLLENFNRPSMAVVLWQPRNTVSNLVEDLATTHRATPTADPVRQNLSEVDELPEAEPIVADVDSDSNNNNEPVANFNMPQPGDVAMDEDL